MRGARPRRFKLRSACEGGAHALGEYPLHFLRLGAQHRLTEAAELPGQGGLDLIAYLGSPGVVCKPRERRGGEPADDPERRALHFGLDLGRRLRPHDLDHDVELELEVGDLGLQHRGVMVGIDLVEVGYAVDAGGEETRIAHLRIDRIPRRGNEDVAGEFHDCCTPVCYACSFTRLARAVNSPAMRSGTSSGVRWRAPARTARVDPLIARCIASAMATGVA